MPLSVVLPPLGKVAVTVSPLWKFVPFTVIVWFEPLCVGEAGLMEVMLGAPAATLKLKVFEHLSSGIVHLQAPGPRRIQGDQQLEGTGRHVLNLRAAQRRASSAREGRRHRQPALEVRPVHRDRLVRAALRGRSGADGGDGECCRVHCYCDTTLAPLGAVAVMVDAPTETPVTTALPPAPEIATIA